MKTTIISELKNEIANKGAMNYSEVLELSAKYTDVILSTDECLWGVDKTISGYGTWKARITFVNEYRFGKEIAEMLKGMPGIITHDEDAEFNLGNWEEEINDALVEMIQNICEEEEESEGLSLAERFEDVKGIDLPIYLYNGAQGCIYDNEFVRLEELEKKEDIDFDLVTWTIDDSYSGYSGQKEIDEHEIVCPEDEQRLMLAWATNDYAASDQWERMLVVDTDKYHDWTSDRTRFMDNLFDDFRKYGEPMECRKQEWEDICARYSNPLNIEEKNSIDYDDIVDEVIR